MPRVPTTGVVVQQPGGPEVLRLQQIDVPDPGPGQVRVAVAAAGVNFMDVYRRTGSYPGSFPFVPGDEGCGRVVAVGEGVLHLAVGDRVAWAQVSGSYATAVVGSAEHMVRVPADVGDEAAAAMLLQGCTAHYLTRDTYRIRPGDVVLVHAGAGGMGLLLIQLAKKFGATVCTTVSTPDKAVLAEGAGADEVMVGYSGVPDWIRSLTGGLGVQAVYDGVGRDTFDDSLASLAVRGTMVLFGASSGSVPPFDIQRLNRSGSLFLTRPTLRDYLRTGPELTSRADELFGWVSDGSVSVRVGATYPLAQASRAHADLEARRTTGKVLLLP